MPTCARNSSSACRAFSAQPGSDSALETVFNDFITALQALVDLAGFERVALRACSAGQVLAQQLNGMTADIQGLRSDAELGLSDAVTQANEAMRNIARSTGSSA